MNREPRFSLLCRKSCRRNQERSIRRKWRGTTAAILAVCHVAACSRPEASRSDVSVSMVAFDSVVLQESPGQLLARPSSIAQSPIGDYFVSDRLLGQVFRFSHDGRFLNLVGRKGDGPGEFEAPRSFAFLGDSIVVAFDPGLRRAQRFTVQGAIVGPGFPLPFDLSQSVSAMNVVWIGGSNQAENFAVVRWETATGAISKLVRLPTRYRRTPLLLLLGGAIVAPGDANLLLGFGGGEVYTVDPLTGEITDSLSIPVLRRRGLPAHALKAALAGDGFGLLNGASSLSIVGRLHGGGVVLVFRDLTREQVHFTGRAYVTVLDARGSPLCVDMPLPQAEDAAPLLSLVGDTVVALEQVSGQANTVRTVVRRFVVHADPKCM